MADCREVLSTIFDFTLDHGTLWLVADSLRVSRGRGLPWRLEPLPFHLSDEATKAGWTLRDVVIWQKDRSVPWSGRGRLRNVFEYILHFVKSENYKYHLDRIRIPARLEEWWVRFPERYHPLGKAPPNLWCIPIPRQGAWKPTTAAPHACPLPGELVERLILLSTDKNDVVFDPFAGIGSVVAHAERLGRRGLGLELNPAFVTAYWNHVRPQVTKSMPTITDNERARLSDEITDKLITLRVLKLPRVLYETIRPAVSAGHVPTPLVLAVLARIQHSSQAIASEPWAEAKIIAASSGPPAQRTQLTRALLDAASLPPASKFGIDVSVEVIPSAAFAEAVDGQALHHYPKGRTWKSEGPITPDEALKEGQRCEANRRPQIPPIVSNLYASEEPRPIG